MHLGTPTQEAGNQVVAGKVVIRYQQGKQMQELQGWPRGVVGRSMRICIAKDDGISEAVRAHAQEVLPLVPLQSLQNKEE